MFAPDKKLLRNCDLCLCCMKWSPKDHFGERERRGNIMSRPQDRRRVLGRPGICDTCAIRQLHEILRPVAAYCQAVKENRHTPELKAKARQAKRRAVGAERRAAELRARPRWVNAQAIAVVYREAVDLTAKTGEPHHVDHIVPLRHPLVCGLHVPWNLQAIPARENLSKNNRFEVEGAEEAIMERRRFLIWEKIREGVDEP